MSCENREVNFVELLLKETVLVFNRDEEVRVVEDDGGFLVDLVVTAKDGCLEVVGVGLKVVISCVLSVGDLPLLSIRLEDQLLLLTVFRFILSSLVYLVERR